jgi:tetratricopeptide (TPR) repeat protein
MAKIKAKPKKSLAQVENPITLWETVREYVEQNARQLGAIALAVGVVAGVVFLWTTMRAQTARESLSMFNEAMNTLGGPAPGTKGATPVVSYDRALEQFKAVHEKHGGTLAGRTALLYAGNCAYNLKRYDEAMGYYQQFLDVAHGELQYLKSAAYEGMGYASEGKGDLKAAADWFEKQKSENQTEGFAILNLARVAESGGDRAKACSLYKEFLVKNPSSGQKQLAQMKADSLCAKKGT